MKKKWILPLVFTAYTIVVVLLLVFALYQKAEVEYQRQIAQEARTQAEKSEYEVVRAKEAALDERDKYEKLLKECAGK